MIIITTCNGYAAEGSAATAEEAAAKCRELEERANDGYARVAWCRGRLVADAEGPVDESSGSPPYDAATATGMYDR